MGEEKIHIRPVRSKDVALLKDLGFSSPHILFKSAAKEAKPARGNSPAGDAVSWNIASMSSEGKSMFTNTGVDLKRFFTSPRCAQCV